MKIHELKEGAALFSPLVIQGGMGAGVSSWTLAKAVSKAGQLGVVSGTALDMILARRLQTGDPGGHMLRALRQFPFPAMAARVLERYFVPGGKKDDEPFKPVPMCSAELSRAHQELIVIANFVEVYLAKEGHAGRVGINYLEKIQLPQLASIYGAMLAGVDYVMVGAGIPREIPGILDSFAANRDASLKLNVLGADKDDDFRITFSPREFAEGAGLPALKRPAFFAIIASTVLAQTLVKKGTGRVDGLVIEGASAGGHNALPRGALRLDESGEPVYGPKDDVDLDSIKALGVPFWLAGAYGGSLRLKEALSLGASGIQAGTPFAFSAESGLTDEIRGEVLSAVSTGKVRVFTDPKASPTGFPFKVAALSGSHSEEDVFEARERVCDLGYLRHVYKKDDGSLGYRCPAEPVHEYVRKGGRIEDTEGCKCLCNGLMANIGLPQRRASGYVEKPLVTAGKDFSLVKEVLEKVGKPSYSAKDVLDSILGEECLAASSNCR
ncbi:MAG: nitronate monooxygenase [Deltaproteobacteria bacterium]|nr:nitronate monooxygenase [Deltaproteobacteria bacterium]MBZ0219866.1 nitronate monooxygenase [Deltaproteobacteria bacterium]